MAKIVCVKERLTILKNNPDEFKTVLDECVTHLKNKGLLVDVSGSFATNVLDVKNNSSTYTAIITGYTIVDTEE